MKIDEECINHNAIRVIEAIITNGEQSFGECNENTRASMLGAIAGVLDLRNALKEVLKV